MANYLLIESRDPYATHEVRHDFHLACNLAKAGNKTTLFLVQNGVIPTRKNAISSGLLHALDNGVEILCDEFSLRERGISEDTIMPGINIAPIDTIIDHMVDGSKVLWL